MPGIGDKTELLIRQMVETLTIKGVSNARLVGVNIPLSGIREALISEDCTVEQYLEKTIREHKPQTEN